ncbi:LysR substrate-binding domain-containing protein [Rhizobium leucaenae]|uniref:DNA-binding transcriptional LysR family regulator n=1 Tax=Rhizobium leucaenae TaxID=29450 RepID=A0A7W7EKD1_9HYPH|nr:LysR substrate-binding domain-containing protein [Rhizobium leucaenae]MBB4568379.1 DNA-binding transcriptional LysR family regulator [Rhizobium leucaenae]MBB6300462.1 DNA-binding transcriptional LysR family regulator [Rhizobium leucaenae]
MKNLNSVHLNGLRALEAVGRLGSLQAAADELGVTIGAVSQQVIKVEAQLGRPVFERTPKGMMVTEAGISVLARLGEGFQALSAAVTAAQHRDDNILTISVAPVLAARWLVHRLDRFAKRHPDIRLRIDATMQLINPATSDVDIGIRVGDGQWADVHSELLLEQEVFPVVTPQIASRLKEPADLLQVPAVIDGRAMFTWEVWLSKVGLSGKSMEERHIFNDASLCLDASMAGQGVMLAWQTLAAYALQQKCLVDPFGIRAKTGFGHYFITAEGVREAKKVTAFKAWMRDELEESMKLFR